MPAAWGTATATSAPASPAACIARAPGSRTTHTARVPAIPASTSSGATRAAQVHPDHDPQKPRPATSTPSHTRLHPQRSTNVADGSVGGRGRPAVGEGPPLPVPVHHGNTALENSSSQVMRTSPVTDSATTAA